MQATFLWAGEQWCQHEPWAGLFLITFMTEGSFCDKSLAHIQGLCRGVACSPAGR